MKQKKIDGILYIFETEAYVITADTDADVIYVQEEYLDDFAELNPTLEFTKYNYKLMRITKPEWYDAYHEEDEPEEEGYSPDAVEPVNGDYSVLSFPNGDRGVGLRMTAANPVIEADRQSLEDDFTSIGASDDDLIDDLVGEYDTEAAVEGTDIDLGTIVVKKSAFGRYSFQSQGSEIMSVDYSDTTSYVGTIDTTYLAASLTGDEGIATFSLVNQQPITKQEAGIYFNTDEYTVDIYDGTTSAEIELVENPNNLPVEYSVNDQDLSLTVESSYITVGQLKEGDFTVTAYTPGNDYFLSGSATTSLEVTNVVPKIDPQISWTQEEYVLNTYGGLTYIDCEYNNPNNITGIIAATWGDGPGPWSATSDGLTYIRFSYAGSGELATGKVNISIGYLGDETYAEAWDTSSYITVVNVAPVIYDDYPIQANGDQTQEFSDPTDITPEDIVSVIKDNITWTETGEPVEYYPDSYVPVPFITIYDGDINDNVKIVDYVSLGTLEDSASQAYGAVVTAASSVVLDSSYWTIKVYIPSTDYNGVYYRDMTVTFTDSFLKTEIEYPVTLLNSDIQFDPDVSDQDIVDAITGNLDGYDSSWMPEPSITVMFGSGDSDVVCSDVPMSQLDFSSDMSNITFGSTVWTVYYDIASTTYVDEEYNAWTGSFTISFVDYAPTYEDYPVTLLSSTAEVEYEEGSSDSNYVSAVADALMGLIGDYDDTWMPTPTCLIYAPDPEDPNTEVPITEDSEIGGSTFSDDLSAAFNESGAVVADQTTWHVTMIIPSSTYAGDDYQAWGSGDIYLSFVSPGSEPSPEAEDYPVSILQETVNVEYDAGSSDNLSNLEYAIMANLNGFNNSWMPQPVINIYDVTYGHPITITEDHEIWTQDFEDDVQAVFDAPAGVTADLTQWEISVNIPASTYGGVEYQDFGGTFYVDFISPA